MGTTWSKTHGIDIDPTQMWRDLALTLDSLVPDADVYNWRASNTRRLYRSLQAAAAGTGSSDHLIIGDDQTYSRTWSTASTFWPELLRTRLTNAGVTAGGTGWVRCSAGGAAYLDSRIVKTSGTWTVIGYQAHASATEVGAVLTFTSQLPGTVAQVAYHDNSGPFTVSIDGAAPVTVTPTGAASIGVVTVSSLANTVHTITVTTTTTAATKIAAFNVSRTGLRVHNLAGQAMDIPQFQATVDKLALPSLPAALLPTVDVVHIAMGLLSCHNEYAAFAQRMTSVRNQWPGADVILYTPFEPDPAWMGAGKPWAATLSTLYALADEWGCPLIDHARRTGGWAVASPAGMMTGSFTPSALGQKSAELAIASAISAASNVPGLPDGLKVSPPSSATAAGKPGQWATDASRVFFYVGDGTTHSWGWVKLSTTWPPT